MEEVIYDQSCTGNSDIYNYKRRESPNMRMLFIFLLFLFTSIPENTEYKPARYTVTAIVKPRRYAVNRPYPRPKIPDSDQSPQNLIFLVYNLIFRDPMLVMEVWKPPRVIWSHKH
jgi:hypothetical protein